MLDADSSDITTADVLVDGDRILDVGVSLDGSEVVDCRGALLIPGLIDCHAHVAFPRLSGQPRSVRPLAAVPAMRTLLAHGVTTVRDAWGADAGLKFALSQGWIEGPDLLLTLRQLSTTGGIGDPWRIDQPSSEAGEDPALPNPVFNGADEARAAVRRMVRAGADWIKVVASGALAHGRAAQQALITDLELQAIVAEACQRGRDVMVHAHGARPAELAAACGARSIEHGVWLDDDAVEKMAEHGSFYVPTLSATHRGPDDDNEQAMSHRESLTRAIEAGVPIAMGSDAPMRPYADVLDEIHFLDRAGLGPAGALRAATSTAAELIRRAHDIGAIKQGMTADLVLLEGIDLDTAHLQSRVRGVWKAGRPVAVPGAAPMRQSQ